MKLKIERETESKEKRKTDLDGNRKGGGGCMREASYNTTNSLSSNLSDCKIVQDIRPTF